MRSFWRKVISLVIVSMAALVSAASAKDSGVPALMEGLRADDVAVSSAAADSLFKTGPDAIPFLEKALQDSNFLVRQRSADVLGRFGPRAKEAAPALTPLLNDNYPDIRIAAQKALIQMSGDAVPALSQALRREEEGYRPVLIETLGKCGPSAAPVLLAELRREENAYLRVAAATALGEIEPVPEIVIPGLIASLGDLNEGVRGAVADALGHLQGKAKTALRALQKAEQEDKDPLVQQKARDAIAQIQKSSDTHVP